MMKFNKGEWSELFVVACIFNDSKIKIADSSNYLKVIKVYFNNKNSSYIISDKDITTDKEKTYALYTKQEVISFLSELSESRGASFSLAKGNEFIQKYDIPTVKEAKNKGDIDTNTLFPNKSEGRDVNFSIKSFVGNPPTLLNSSQATNFTFEIQSFTGDIEKINAISSRSKIKNRLAEIRNCSEGIEIAVVDDKVFHENLLKIDTRFLEMLSPMLLNFYSSKWTTVKDLVEHTENRAFGKDIIELNMKRFLRAFALGMKPKEPWSGDNVTGGSILVKKTGELLVHTLYDMDKFEGFLYGNCKLDTPSSTKHKFGEVYACNGKHYIKLNLQIRFK